MWLVSLILGSFNILYNIYIYNIYVIYIYLIYYVYNNIHIYMSWRFLNVYCILSGVKLYVII